jgi:hypothetical protein
MIYRHGEEAYKKKKRGKGKKKGKTKGKKPSN